MATEILPVSSVHAASSDVVIDAPTTVALKGLADNVIDENAMVSIEIKDDDGKYFQVDSLTDVDNAKVITGAGTYRFVRNRGTCGVFSG